MPTAEKISPSLAGVLSLPNPPRCWGLHERLGAPWSCFHDCARSWIDRARTLRGVFHRSIDVPRSRSWIDSAWGYYSLSVIRILRTYTMYHIIPNRPILTLNHQCFVALWPFENGALPLPRVFELMSFLSIIPSSDEEA